MPRHIERPLPAAEAILEALRRSGVEDAPDAGPDAAWQGLLYLAAHLVDHQKRVSFPSFSWSAPKLVAKDEKVTVGLDFVELRTLDDLRELPRGSILAMDARPTRAREYELTHRLYGTPTLHPRRGWARDPKDRRIERAREAGWARTLKDHNLLAGRGLVVLDDDQGLFLSDPEMEEVPGMLTLLPSGDVIMLWNPFARKADSEMQYWLQWGAGGPSSAWKEIMRYEGED